MNEQIAKPWKKHVNCPKSCNQEGARFDTLIQCHVC